MIRCGWWKEKGEGGDHLDDRWRRKQYVRKKVGITKQFLLTRGIPRFGTGRIRTHVHKAGARKKEAKKWKRPVNKKVVEKQDAKFYSLNEPTQHISHGKPTPPRLRASITPGTILILVAGRYASKRVVFLKQLTSGLLLVTGPFGVNGVPLRRVNQAYVIATSTKIDISSVKLPEKLNDAYFKKPKKEKKAKSEAEFFAKKSEEKKKTITPERKEDNNVVDKALAPILKNVPFLEQYLKTHFTLRNNQFPQEMKFWFGELLQNKKKPMF